MINMLNEEIKKLEKELNKEIGYYINKYRDLLPKNKEKAMLMAEKIKEKKEKEILLKLDNLKQLFENEKEKRNKLNMKFNGLFMAALNCDLNICEYIRKIQKEELVNSFNDFNKSDGYKCTRYSFNFNNTEEYFFEKDGKFLLTERGKEFNSLIRSKVDMKKLYKIINRMGIFGEKIKDNIEIVYYIISKHNKLVQYYSLIYDNSDFFVREINDDIEKKIELYVEKDFLYGNNKGAGAIKTGEEKDVNFITSFTVDVEINNDNLKKIETYKLLNELLNIKQLNTTKKEFIQQFKNKQIRCTIIISRYEETTQCYLIFDINNEVQKFIKLSIKGSKLWLENIINNKKINLNEYGINISLLANESDEEELFYEKLKNKIKEEDDNLDKTHIMIVGGNWSESSKNEVLKDYNAIFVSLEDYERYSEKSKNMDYIFIDTSANTHSNYFKAQSIHDNVKLINRSKKEEIDKLIK